MVTLVMCLEGVVGREVMCLVGKPWHTVLLSLIKPGRMLKTLCRNENVIEELQADMNSFFAATFNLPSENFLHLWSEHQHTESHLSVRGSIT